MKIIRRCWTKVNVDHFKVSFLAKTAKIGICAIRIYALGSTIAYRLSANGRPLNPFTQQNSGNTTAIFNATVWTPPLVDQLVVDEKHHHHLEHGAESVASSAREEVMSESTGRSESSTPVQRQNNHHNTNLASPIPMTTVW